jgi:uncharacterized protein
MWRFLEQDFEQLSPADKAKLAKDADPYGTSVRFSGFDGNNEPHYHIASYMVKDLPMAFEHFKGRDLNSHHPSVDRYRRCIRCSNLSARISAIASSMLMR